MQISVTRGVLSARRISCLPFHQIDFDNWTAKCTVFLFQAMKACGGSTGVAPLILNLDTKWRRNNLFMGAEGGILVAGGPGLLPVRSIRILDLQVAVLSSRFQHTAATSPTCSEA
jgi:hypothetical protein